MQSSHNYLFTSDFHLSEGVNPVTGKLSRNEDFFYDLEFARFVVYHVRERAQAPAGSPLARPWKLCINGDIWDFLQVTSLPPSDHPIFTKYGIELTPNKLDYGLGTSEPETVWKLHRIVEGHTLFFQTLGWFLAQPGHELILLKGNHDIELHWPKVQAAVRHLIAEQYAVWYGQDAAGNLPDTPFPRASTLPRTLDHLETAVQFPRWFYYEPGLFYVEHGSQYDSANAYRNFLNPVVPDRPDLIELPSGSFFVRYFFNKIEQLHPFADNLRPLSRYVNWALNAEPLDTLQLVLRNPRTIWKFFTNFTAKQTRQASLQRAHPGPGKGDKIPLPLEHARREKLQDLQERFQDEGQKRSGASLRASALSVLLKVLMVVLALWGLREFMVGAVGLFLLAAVGVTLAYLASAFLGRQLNEVDNYLSLRVVAQEIQAVLAEPLAGETAAVPFYIFGHDHFPTFDELTPSQPNIPFRQWYINTGSWLSNFNENDLLVRNNLQLTFFRLVPGLPDFGQGLPELLEWQPDANQPRPIRLLETRPTPPR